MQIMCHRQKATCHFSAPHHHHLPHSLLLPVGSYYLTWFFLLFSVFNNLQVFNFVFPSHPSSWHPTCWCLSALLAEHVTLWQVHTRNDDNIEKSVWSFFNHPSVRCLLKKKRRKQPHSILFYINRNVTSKIGSQVAGK